MKLMICLVVTSLTAPLFACPQENDEAKPAAPETVTAEARPLVVFEKIQGVIESPNYAEIELDSNGWADFEISYVIPQGVPVEKGEQLVAFDTEGIEKALRDMQLSHQDLVMDLAAKKLSAEQAVKRFDLGRSIAERSMKNARDDYQYYLDVERPQRLKDLDYSLKMAEYSLEYSREELDQLMQMYNEDELTEESEQIVLKRAQRSVESAERSLERRVESTNQSRNVEIPREDFDQKNALDQQALDFAKTMLELPNEKEKAATALQKAEIALKEGSQKLQELTEDKELMVISAPMAGIIYYGRCVDGKWSGVSGTAARTLEMGKKIPAKKIVMTIIDPSSLVIRASLSEEKLSRVNVGDVGRAVMKSDNKIVVPLKLVWIDKVPSGAGTFGCLFSPVDFDNKEEKVLPGMNCTVSLKLHATETALMVPKASLFSDDGIRHYVYRLDGQQQDVELGFADGDDVEVVAGLKAGEKIRKTKP